MFEFILLFFPGILSVSIYFYRLPSRKNHDYSEENPFSRLSWKVGVSVFYILLDNLISLFLFLRCGHLNATTLNGHLSPTMLSIKYLAVAFVIALVTGFLGLILKINFSVMFAVEPKSYKRTLKASKPEETKKN